MYVNYPQIMQSHREPPLKMTFKSPLRGNIKKKVIQSTEYVCKLAPNYAQPQRTSAKNGL